MPSRRHLPLCEVVFCPRGRQQRFGSVEHKSEPHPPGGITRSVVSTQRRVRTTLPPVHVQLVFDLRTGRHQVATHMQVCGQYIINSIICPPLSLSASVCRCLSLPLPGFRSAVSNLCQSNQPLTRVGVNGCLAYKDLYENPKGVKFRG